MLLFRDEEHVDRWCGGQGVARGAIFGASTLWGLAWTWYRDRLSPGWRRRTPEEAEAVFGTLGLTGAFWKLRP